MKPLREDRQEAIRDKGIAIGSIVSFAAGPGLPAGRGEVLGIDEDDLGLYVEGRKDPLCPLEVQKVLST